MRKLRTWVAVGLTAAVGLTLAAAQAGTASAAPSTRWTAAQIADGLLFNDGPAARALAGLHRAPTAWTAELRDARVRIDRAVSADPAWSATFVREMRSGDPRQVAQGLADLGDVARQVLDARSGSAGVSAAVSYTNQSWANNQMARMGDFSLTSHFGAQLGTIYGGLDLGGVYTPTVPGQVGLRREMLVADIARGLRAGQ
ncbi:hypothetical protein Lfu02_64640 [Longispora fulva]|uniref:DUF4142 domain-containing protein n=1 Tax=Longispora fulva TaxID=619741 RepID=A0A8J7KLB0_9ACTN|nr:hypothetical protein [Longispora fulva]MBG6137751.1 hypothetical protein [Longispora fulva]GIG62092.1 hypothetical protein Lfu02_64640 [Longispora fulva]